MRLAPRLALILVMLSVMPAAAQDTGVPFVPDAWKYGRRADASRLRICVDTRDGGWEVEREIGAAIAGALLLEPVIHEVSAGPEVETLDELYEVMLRHCAVHLGFKLLPGVYPDWLMPTRAYYRARYVFVTSDPGWERLADVPVSQPVASTLGTRADFRLISYILSLGEGEGWARHPYATPARALTALRAGEAKVALVWEPALWAAQRAASGVEALRVIEAAPLPEAEEGVGAVVLARETFLRTSIDQAIAALVSDGTIAAILERHGYPAQAAR